MFRNANGHAPGAVTPIKKSAGGDRATTTDFKNDSKSVAACDRLAMVITLNHRFNSVQKHIAYLEAHQAKERADFAARMKAAREAKKLARKERGPHEQSD